MGFIGIPVQITTFKKFNEVLHALNASKFLKQIKKKLDKKEVIMITSEIELQVKE